MTDNIKSIIKGIDDTLEWFRVNKPEQYGQQFLDLVSKRLELRTIQETLRDNPGIAAYGESQKGKSYLMSNLLQDNGSPFMVLGPDGHEYNYVDELNPLGGGQEATGVVTRFTSFLNDKERYSREYPVLMKVHRVHEIVTILTDGYHFDVMDYKQWLSPELDKLAEKLVSDYDSRPEAQNLVVEDDILAIKNYLGNYVNGAQLIYQSEYLDTLARVIRKVPVGEFAKVFAPLWHMQEDITDLFKRLLSVLERLDFASEIYMPVDAIEHHQEKPRTVMSVQCLNGFYNPNFEYKTPVYLRNGNDYREIPDFNRAQLSAVCREIVLKVEDRYLNCKMSYDVSMIDEAVLNRLPRREFKRDLLSHADLLDFPGARNRETLLSKNLDKIDVETGEHNMIKVLLRGKIAYLFNHYNSARALNLLMFCHDTANVEVTKMYQVIEKWIETYVGADSAQRARTVKECDGVPPFFVISTKFNQSMTENTQSPNQNSEVALGQRWINRFNILYKDSFHAGTDVEWFKSWDGPGQKFNNIYVLRDYKFSAVGGEGSNLYNGYNARNPREESLAISMEHFENMRNTYIKMLTSHNVLKNMVRDPELSWDLSATINNDGSVYIIDNLTKVASRLGALRERQFDTILGDVRNQLCRILDAIYIDPQGRDAIRETKKSVGMMRLSFDKAVNSDNYFFGRLMEALQMKIRETYQVVQKTVNDPSLTEEVHGANDWEVIREDLKDCKTKEECLNVLMLRYGCSTVEELYDTTAAMGIDIDEIISNREPSPKVSDIIAQRALKAWEDKINLPSTARRACDDALNQTQFGLLRDKLVAVAGLIGLDKLIASRICDMTDVNNLSTVNQYQVADTISLTINEFVKDWGYSVLDPAKRAELQGYDSKYSFNIFDELTREKVTTFDEDSLTALFARLTANASGLSESFRENYREWFACLTLAFLRVELDLGVIIPDPAANESAGRILDSLRKVG